MRASEDGQARPDVGRRCVVVARPFGVVARVAQIVGVAELGRTRRRSRPQTMTNG